MKKSIRSGKNRRRRKREREMRSPFTKTIPFAILLVSNLIGPNVEIISPILRETMSFKGLGFIFLNFVALINFEKLIAFGGKMRNGKMKPENLLLRFPTSRKLTTGCEILDGCLHGGISCDSLTEIVAESGCGKTQLCLQLSLYAQLPISRGGLDGSALYLHSEFPFPFRRLHQLSRAFHQSNPDVYANHNDNPCDHVFVQNVHSVDHMFDIMSRINAFVVNSKTRLPLKLIVLDSVAALFRSEFDNTPSDLRKRSSLFFKISAKLKELANKFDLAVVITNQVTDFVESSDGLNGLRIGNLRYLHSSGRRVVPALGLAWANCVNSRFFISRSDDSIAKERTENDESGPSSVFRRSQRRLDIVFSPYLPGTSCEFMITREGICAVQALVISGAM